jgi:two-component sensor histidine kinase
MIPYVPGNGVVTSSFKSFEFITDPQGQWMTFSNTEVIGFRPGNIEPARLSPPVVEITGFRLFDKPVFIDSFLAAQQPVRLTHKENFFSIEFAALDFSDPQQTSYAYRLQGTDKDWVNAGTNRFASYTDLQPGSYRFEVKAGRGDVFGKPTSFEVIIRPPFWKTTWFRTLAILLLAGLIYATIQWRIRSIYRESREKLEFTKRISEMEMNALRSQMNPHFIFNCINSIDALIQSNDKYQATLYLNKFAKLLRNILDSNKQNVVTFSKDMEAILLYIELEELRHENKFTTKIYTDPQLMNSDYKVPPLIVQPFIENAILHGLKNREDNNGELNIRVTKTDEHILYIIGDNGIGREAAAKIMQNKTSHYGMQISMDRIKLFNKEETPSVEIIDLYEQGIASGTEIRVRLNII